MSDFVQIRALDHLTGDEQRPRIGYIFETRDRPGPGFKQGVFSDDEVWLQLEGGLFVAKARIRIAWKGEYSRIDEIKGRAPGAQVPESFWSGRPRNGYAIVGTLEQERWVDPFWAGPRSYNYELVALEGAAKRASWLEPKQPPRGGESLRDRFLAARARGFAAPAGTAP